jgi:hypothetical protein
MYGVRRCADDTRLVCRTQLPSQDTHGPSDVPINYLAPYEETIQDPVRRQLAAKLSVLDELILNVTKALEEKGMLEETLIIYTAGMPELC